MCPFWGPNISSRTSTMTKAKACHRRSCAIERWQKLPVFFVKKIETWWHMMNPSKLINTFSIFFVPTRRLQKGGCTMFPYRLCASPEMELHHEVWWDLGCLQTSAYSPWRPAPSSLKSEANRTYHSLITNRPYPNMKNGPGSIYRNSICQLQSLYYTDASGLSKKPGTPVPTVSGLLVLPWVGLTKHNISAWQKIVPPKLNDILCIK